MSAAFRKVCVALDSNAKRCRRPAARYVQYHGEHELYDFNEKLPRWVIVPLCDKHSEPEPRKRVTRADRGGRGND